MKQRSEKNIKMWLRTRLWYRRYKSNLITERSDESSNYLEGKMGSWTLYSAFTYKNTPEGVEYWSDKEEKFLKWYYNHK